MKTHDIVSSDWDIIPFRKKEKLDMSYSGTKNVTINAFWGKYLAFGKSACVRKLKNVMSARD